MTVISVIGLGLPEQIETHREAFVRAVRAAFRAGADRVELVDDGGTRPVGWIEADGRAHFQTAEAVLPFDGHWPFDG